MSTGQAIPQFSNWPNLVVLPELLPQATSFNMFQSIPCLQYVFNLFHVLIAYLDLEHLRALEIDCGILQSSARRDVPFSTAAADARCTYRGFRRHTHT